LLFTYGVIVLSQPAAQMKQAVRVATQYAPPPLLPQWTPKRLTPPSRPQYSSTFPQSIRSHADRCSCLMP